jgi:hypothetical protein
VAYRYQVGDRVRRISESVDEAGKSPEGVIMTVFTLTAEDSAVYVIQSPFGTERLCERQIELIEEPAVIAAGRVQCYTRRMNGD